MMSYLSGLSQYIKDLEIQFKNKISSEKPKILNIMKVLKCENLIQNKLTKIAGRDDQQQILEYFQQYFPQIQQLIQGLQQYVLRNSILQIKTFQSQSNDTQTTSSTQHNKKKKEKRKKHIDNEEEEEETSNVTVKGFALSKYANATGDNQSMTYKKSLESMKKVETLDSLIEYYDNKRIICKSIYDEFKLHFQGVQKGYYIAKLTKNQVVKQTNRSDFLALDNIDEIQNYIVNNSHNYNIIEHIKPLAKGGEAQILRLKVIQPIETVVKIPLPQANEILNSRALNLILMESHLLKLIAHKDYISQIMEEIIEYNAETKQIKSYVCIVEQAQNDLSKILEIWNDQTLSSEEQESFSQEKLAYFCLKAMEALEYVHSNKIYFGDMKPQNLLVFRDFSVKLGDFGVSIKIPDEVQDIFSFQCELKGLTPEYSMKELFQKNADGEMVSYREMIQNDYHCLYLTFQKIFLQFEDKIESNSFFYWMLYDLKELNIDTKELKTILFKWRAILANDSDVILNLCDGIIKEEKLYAIPNILKLSKYKNIFSEIQEKFAKEEQAELQYVNEKQYQPIAEDDMLLDQQFQVLQDSYANIYIQLSLVDAKDRNFISNVIKDIDPYFQKLFQFNGSLPISHYKQYYQNHFDRFYNEINSDRNWNWENLLNIAYDQLLNYFSKNTEIFIRFSKFYSINRFSYDQTVGKKIHVLIQIALDLKQYHLELQLILSQLKILQNIQDESLLNLAEKYIIRVEQISQQYLQDDHSNEKIISCHILYASFLFTNNKLSKIEEIQDIMKDMKDFECYKQSKSKSFYSNLYILKSKILKSQLLNQDQSQIIYEYQILEKYKIQEKYLKKERTLYSKIFGEQGDQMNRNAFDLYELYKNINNSDKQFFYLKKIANYSFKNQKIKFMTNLVQEYFEKNKTEDFKLTIQSFRKINPALEFLLLIAYDQPYQLDDNQINICQGLIRNYKFIEDFIANQLEQIEIFKKSLLQVINLPYTEDADIYNLYNEWVNSQDQQNFDQFDMKQYLLDGKYINDNFDCSQLFEVQINFTNGTKYVGQIKNYKFEGKGMIQFFDGIKYEGEFRSNKKHGKGTYTFPDQSSYEGQWLNDKKNGFGIQKQQNGITYSGFWLNDKRNGQGKLFNKKEVIYEGKWKLNQKHGRGQLTYPDGSSYKGGFKNNKRNGLGTMKYANRDIYHGQWLDDLRNGKGVMMEASGNIYDGSFKNDKKNGQGKMTYAKDDKIQCYEGEWFNDQKHGKGTLKFINNDVYEGQYQFDKRQGKGKFNYYNDDFYDGEWKDDKKNGQGKLTVKNGEIYEGEWVNDNKQGRGTITNILQEKQEYIFYCNQTIEQTDQIYSDGCHYIGTVILNTDIKQGEGKLIFTNGDVYKGLFINDQMHGDGTLQYANGEIYVGQFENGKKHGKATVQSKNGDRFEGFYVDDMKSGKATIYNETTGKKIKIEFYKNNPLEYKDTKYPNGDSYEGWFCHGKRQGQGQMVYSNGEKYIGEFSDDKKNGKGIFINSKGEKYEGMFCDDEKHGNGIITSKNGQKLYDGEFYKNKWQGRGVLYLANGNKYEGIFENGIRKGKGIMTYSNGDKYDGQFENDLRHGQGIMSYKIGGQYSGEFVNDKKHGIGSITYPNGDVYEGQFENDLKQGKGVYTYRNGSKYEGYFENDEKQGNGSYISQYQDKFEGYFDRKTLKGTGVLINNYNDKYSGEVNSMFEKHGQGIYKDTNGSKYDGQFFKNRKQGMGTYNYKDGSVFEGWFDNDYRIRGELRMCTGDIFVGGFTSDNISNGEYRYANGDIYTGEFNSSQQKHGKGFLEKKDGETYKGDFSNDLYDGNGKIKYANGEIFQGIFTKGQCQQGTMILKDGTKNECQFKDGKILPKNSFKNDKGDLYNGQVDGAATIIKQGFGILDYSNGDKYTGWFNNDKREGKGLLQFKSGIVYEGLFMVDKIQGEGELTYINGEKFKGNFSSSESEGIQLYDDGVLYKGQFLANQRHGQGILKTLQGDVYTGQFISDKKQGQGIMLYHNGDKFEGLFKEDLKYKGVLTLSTSEIFDGEFSQDKFIEIKQFTFENKDEYNGQLLENKKQGKGEIKLSNGDSYVGWFNNDLINGQGIYKYQNADVFEGEFENGDRLKGKLTKSDGSVFEGTFQKGLIYRGTYTESNGNVLLGEFDSNQVFLPIKQQPSLNNSVYDGQILQEKMQGKGVLTFPSGIKFDGWFNNDSIQGNGVFILSNGQTVDIGDIGSMGSDLNASTFKLYDNGEIYIGEMSGYYRNGKGVYIKSDGNTLCGTFETDRLQYVGTRIFPNGDKFIGEFSSDDMCGRGYMQYANGDKDELCYYYNGKKCEKVDRTESNGDRFVGQVKDDGKRNGRGILYYANGDVYDGWFDYGRIHTYGWKNKDEETYGILTKANGEKYKIWYYEDNERKREQIQ